MMESVPNIQIFSKIKILTDCICSVFFCVIVSFSVYFMNYYLMSIEGQYIQLVFILGSVVCQENFLYYNIPNFCHQSLHKNFSSYDDVQFPLMKATKSSSSNPYFVGAFPSPTLKNQSCTPKTKYPPFETFLGSLKFKYSAR